jgi:hypothetical protein
MGINLESWGYRAIATNLDLSCTNGLFRKSDGFKIKFLNAVDQELRRLKIKRGASPIVTSQLLPQLLFHQTVKPITLLTYEYTRL